MNSLTLARVRFVPPLWLMLALASLVAVSLLAAFVDTLQENVRRGEALRQGQRAGAARQPAMPLSMSAPVPSAGTRQALTLQP